MGSSAVFMVAAALAAQAAGAAKTTRQVTFDEQTAGQPPAGFNCVTTGRGRPGAWKVVKDQTAPSPPNAVGQMDPDGTSYRFPVCVLDGVSARDVDLSVRFKPVSGAQDQAAGLVWRWRDKDNYYVARANALEANVVLYKVEGGKRTDLKPRGAGLLAYGKKAEVATGTWGLLHVSVRGDLFTVHLGGEKLFEVEDSTFSSAGSVGLWTKADSVTWFDDLRVDVLP